MVNVVAMEMLRTKIPPSKCPLVSNVVGKTTCSYFPKYCSKRQEAVFSVESCEAQMCFHKLLFSKILQQEARGSIASWKAPVCFHKLLFSKILQQVQVRRGTCSILGG